MAKHLNVVNAKTLKRNLAMFLFFLVLLVMVLIQHARGENSKEKFKTPKFKDAQVSIKV